MVASLHYSTRNQPVSTVTYGVSSIFCDSCHAEFLPVVLQPAELGQKRVELKLRVLENCFCHFVHLVALIRRAVLVAFYSIPPFKFATF